MKARIKHTKLSANTKLNEDGKTSLKDFARAFIKPCVSGWALFIKAFCRTKDTLSFGLKNRGDVFYISSQKSLVDVMSKAIDDKYLFFVKSGILSQEEFNDFKTEKIYIDLKSHFSPSKQQ